MQEGKVERAVIQYKKILDYLEYHDAKEDGSPEEKEILQKSKDLKLKGLLNLALCYGKLKDYSEVIDKCNQVCSHFIAHYQFVHASIVTGA